MGSIIAAKCDKCDFIKKDAITLISKKAYEIIRSAHNEALENLNIFSEDTRDYYENLCKMRNKIEY